MFGRSKEWTKAFRSRPSGNSRSVMSARVALSAVAVSASGLDVAERLAGARQVAVFGPEVVAPLRDAMRLVDGEAPDAGARAARRSALHQQALGRDEQQAQRRPARIVRQVSRDSASATVEFSVAAATPKPRICCTWSCISAISGETTTVSESSTSAGNW